MHSPTVFGYQEVTAGDHPLAWADGLVAEHRIVLYDKIGPGPHPCHWCGSEVRWEGPRGKIKLHVDHLDDNRLNNLRDNLVPSCMICNMHRSGKIGRPPGTPNRQRKKVCKYGHPLVPDNLYHYKDGTSRCRACVLRNQRERTRKKALQVLAP